MDVKNVYCKYCNKINDEIHLFCDQCDTCVTWTHNHCKICNMIDCVHEYSCDVCNTCTDDYHYQCNQRNAEIFNVEDMQLPTAYYCDNCNMYDFKQHFPCILCDRCDIHVHCYTCVKPNCIKPFKCNECGVCSDHQHFGCNQRIAILN